MRTLPEHPGSHAPKVTVAMVTFNQSAFIAAAIESVLAQELADFELLICDDASRDTTWEIVKGYSDPRIRAIRNPIRLGEYQNRGQALRLARGELLIFIDGDDLLYPHGLRVMARHLDERPAAAFAAALPASEKFVYPVVLTPRQYYSCQFLGPVIIATDFTQLLFRTACLRAVGGFDARYRTGDTHIQFVLGREFPCVLVANGLAWWRRHPRQASQALLGEGWGRAELACYGRELLEHERCPLPDHDRAQALANIRRPVLRAAARWALRGRWLHALRLLRRARIPLTAWPQVLLGDHRPFWQHVDGLDPISTPLDKPCSALSPPEPRVAVRGHQDPLPDCMPRAKVVDGLAAARNEAVVVEDHVAAER